MVRCDSEQRYVRPLANWRSPLIVYRKISYLRADPQSSRYAPKNWTLSCLSLIRIGAATSVDPHRDLHRTRSFFQTCPQVAHSVRRLRFRGYFTPKACLDIIAIAKICTNAAHVSLPWYIIQYANKLILESTLGSNHRQPVSSLELFAEIPDRQDRGQMLLSRPSRFRLDFSMLRRLKIRSDTDVTPLRDRDLAMIAKSARLEELYVAGLSSISIKGNYF